MTADSTSSSGGSLAFALSCLFLVCMREREREREREGDREREGEIKREGGRKGK